MAGIPETVIEDIRGRTDIVAVIEGYVPLKRRGSDYWACCPFHHEKTPSFKVSAQHQAFYCFGCKKSGNVFNFVMEKENVDFVGAVRLLAQRCGVEIPEARDAGPRGDGSSRKTRDRLYELLEAAALWYRQLLDNDPEAEKARLYLRQRGVPPEVAKAFGLGYSLDSWDGVLQWGQRLKYPPELLLEAGLLVPREGQAESGGYDRFRGRLMFPIWDELGRVVGFSARVLEKDAQTAKYVNSPETAIFHKGRLLYALHVARPAFKTLGFALVCEGQLDVIACHRAGMTNAVAPQGTAFTEAHAALLKRFTEDITFSFDADHAGEQAALRSIEVAIAAELRPKVVALPPGEDPDSLFRKQGAEALAALLRAGKEAIEFVFDFACRGHDRMTAEGKARIAETVLDMIARYPEAVARAGHCQWLAGALALPGTAVFDDLNEHLRKRQRGSERASGRAPATVAATPAPTVPETIVHRAEQMLLDLALHHRDVAHQIAERLDSETVTDSPIGQALNRVLGMSLQGEWEMAARELAADPQLAAVPEVAHVLMETEFLQPVGESGERFQERLQKATHDCLTRIEKHLIQKEMDDVQGALRNTTEAATITELSLRFQELARRKGGKRSPRRPGEGGGGGVSADGDKVKI